MAGGNGVAIRYVYEEVREPFWAAIIRFLLAAILFAGISRVLRFRLPRGGALLAAVLYGVLFFGVGFGLVYWGLLDAPAGLAQVVLACIPLLTFALAVAHRQERFRWDGLVGALVALAGIAVIFRTGLDQGVPLSSLLAIAGGAVCWAEAAIIVKGFPPVQPAMMNAVGMAAGTAILLVLSLVAGESRAMPQTAGTWAAQMYLVVIGSVGTFALYLFVLQRWTASAASYQYVLFPLVAVVLSAWLQDERITWAFAAGSILVVIGVYVGALRQPLSERSTS
jgi:drug/metabolite transporter (DMT)-like permease